MGNKKKEATNYKQEEECIIDFLKEENIILGSHEEMFWNHIFSLLDRVENNEQETIEFTVDNASEKSYKQVEKFIDQMRQVRYFDITDFEKSLLILYFEQFNRGEQI